METFTPQVYSKYLTACETRFTDYVCLLVEVCVNSNSSVSCDHVAECVLSFINLKCPMIQHQQLIPFHQDDFLAGCVELIKVSIPQSAPGKSFFVWETTVKVCPFKLFSELPSAHVIDVLDQECIHGFRKWRLPHAQFEDIWDKYFQVQFEHFTDFQQLDV
jgi:hypothetical protein